MNERVLREDGKVLLTGNTFQCKTELKQLGCEWDSAKKGWWVDPMKERQARLLIARETLAKVNARAPK